MSEELRAFDEHKQWLQNAAAQPDGAALLDALYEMVTDTATLDQHVEQANANAREYATLAARWSGIAQAAESFRVERHPVARDPGALTAEEVEASFRENGAS